MNILLAGGTGLIGIKLRSSELFTNVSWRILTRKPDKYINIKQNNESFISLESFYKNPVDYLYDIDLVINLAGHSIASFPWNKSQKEKILNSRINITDTIVKGILQTNNKEISLFNASAIGYYGLQKDTTVILDESSPPMQSPPGFISEVCQRWEKATSPLFSSGNRVVNLRFGVVLSPEGGLQKQLALAIRLWLAGPLGSGLQPVSWISLDEIPNIIQFLIHNQATTGPVNIVAPDVLTQKDFIKKIARIYHRRAFIPAPSFIIRLVTGQFGRELLLNGQAVMPNKLLEAGYRFIIPSLDEYVKMSLS